MTTLQEKYKIAVYEAKMWLLDKDLLEEGMLQISVSFDIMQHTTADRVEQIWWPMFLKKMKKIYRIQNERFEAEVLAQTEPRTRQELEAQFDAMPAPFG